MQLASAEEADVTAAVALFGIAGAAARRVGRARGEDALWSISSTTAWQSLPPERRPER